MKQPIKKKEFLTTAQKQEKKKRERIERQNEILKNRSEGLQKWSKEHPSAEMILNIVMNALDHVPKKHKKIIVNFLKMPIFCYNQNFTDYLRYENDINDMEAVFEMLEEIHDISAKEVGLESYKEYSDNFFKLLKKGAKRRRAVKKEEIEPYEYNASDDSEGLPF